MTEATVTIASLVLALPLLAYLVGRAVAWRRGPPVGQRDIRYHWRHWTGALIARLRHSTGNWCLTLGRHTFVRGGAIEAQSAAHEFSHSLDAHRVGVVPYVVLCLYQYAVHGYATAAVEVRAHQYAVDHWQQFQPVTEAERWPPKATAGV